MKIQEILRALASQLDAEDRNKTPVDPTELKQDSVMVPPLQQQIELSKAMVGKESEVINDLTRSEIVDGDSDQDSGDTTQLLSDLLKIAGIQSKSQPEAETEQSSNNFNTNNPAAVIVIPGNKSGS